MKFNCMAHNKTKLQGASLVLTVVSLLTSIIRISLSFKNEVPYFHCRNKANIQGVLKMTIGAPKSQFLRKIFEILFVDRLFIADLALFQI